MLKLVYLILFVFLVQPSGALKINKAKCNSKNKGVIQYRNGRNFEFCNGTRFQAVGLPRIGTSIEYPANSCADIASAWPEAPNGVYYLKTDVTVTQVYCHMDPISNCDGDSEKKGWTTIMKTDGNKDTFNYKSSLWTDKVSYQAYAGQTGFDREETKLPTYWTLGFSYLCLGMRSATNDIRWIQLDLASSGFSSLHDVIRGNKQKVQTPHADTWTTLIDGSDLQQHCNYAWFNVGPSPNDRGYARARIGIISNNEDDCDTPDTVIGFGIAYKKKEITTGNIARSYTKSAFGYIMAQ